jgi:hypothetical protein
MTTLRRTMAAVLLAAVCAVTFAAYDDTRLQAAVQNMLAFCTR